MKTWTIYKNGKKFKTFQGTFDQAYSLCETMERRSTNNHEFTFE